MTEQDGRHRQVQSRLDLFGCTAVPVSRVQYLVSRYIVWSRHHLGFGAHRKRRLDRGATGADGSQQERTLDLWR